MKFYASFGRNNTLSLDIKPVTNREFINGKIQRGEEIAVIDMMNGSLFPHSPHHNATFEKAKKFCDGGTVVFA